MIRSSTLLNLRCALLFILLESSVADIRLDGGELGWDTSAWRVQVDGVMGGRSSGYLKFEESNQIMKFTGNINLNGGGFSSVRRQYSDAKNLSEYSGIVVNVKTSASSLSSPPLGLHLQLHDSYTNWGFASAFAVPLSNDPDGQIASVYLPLTSFDRASRSGFQCNSSNCKLNTNSIDGMDVYVLFQEGGFDVNIESITAVTVKPNLTVPTVSFDSPSEVEKLLQSTKYEAKSLGEKNYHELCVAISKSFLESVSKASNGVSERVKCVARNSINASIPEDFTKPRACSLWRGSLASLLGDDANDSSNLEGCDELTSTEGNTVASFVIEKDTNTISSSEKENSASNVEVSKTGIVITPASMKDEVDTSSSLVDSSESMKSIMEKSPIESERNEIESERSEVDSRNEPESSGSKFSVQSLYILWLWGAAKLFFL